MAAAAPKQVSQPPKSVSSRSQAIDAGRDSSAKLAAYMALGFYPPTGPDDPDLPLYKAAAVESAKDPKVKAAVEAAAAVCEADLAILYVAGEVVKAESQQKTGKDAEALIASIQVQQKAKLADLMAEVDKHWKRFLGYVSAAAPGNPIASKKQIDLILHEGTGQTGVYLKPLPQGLPFQLSNGLPLPDGSRYTPAADPVRKVTPADGVSYAHAHVWNGDLYVTLLAIGKQAQAVALTDGELNAAKALQAGSANFIAARKAEIAALAGKLPALKAARDAAFAKLSGFALGFAKAAAAQLCEALALDAKTKIREDWVKFTDAYLAQNEKELAEIDALIAKSKAETDPDKKKSLERLAGAKRAGAAAVRAGQVNVRQAGAVVGQERKGHAENIKQRQAKTGIAVTDAAQLGGRAGVSSASVESAEKKVAELDAKTADQGKVIVKQGETLIDQGDELPDDAKAPGIDDKIKTTSEATGQAGVPWWLWLAGGLVAARILGR